MSDKIVDGNYTELFKPSSTDLIYGFQVFVREISVMSDLLLSSGQNIVINGTLYLS